MAKNKKIKVIPLGGLNEIGKNLTAFEFDKDIIVLDCGIAFPDDEMLGVDLVIPDISYLIKNKDKVKEYNKRYWQKRAEKLQEGCNDNEQTSHLHN